MRKHFLILLLPFLLAACADDEPVVMVQEGFPIYRMAPDAPPASYDEGTPVSADPMMEVWRPGFWDFDGMEYRWVAGQFLQRPDPTATWSPDRWEQRTFGWVFIPGHWQ